MQELDRYPQQRVLALSLWMLSFLTSLTSALSQLSQPQFAFRPLYESVPVLREEQEETSSFLPGLLLQEGIVYTSIYLNNFPEQRVATWCEFIAALSHSLPRSTQASGSHTLLQLWVLPKHPSKHKLTTFPALLHGIKLLQSSLLIFPNLRSAQTTLRNKNNHCIQPLVDVE